MKIAVALCLTFLVGCSSNSSRPDASSMRRAVLSWPPVATATDQTPVTDLTGYRLEVTMPTGTASVDLPPDATTHTLIAPARGSYTFRLFAISASRGESDVSNTVTKTFP